MTENQAPDAPSSESQADPHDLARDWATLWASELAALAVDREWLEWAAQALRPGGAGEPSGRTGAESPAGPAAAAVPPVARDDAARAEIERLGHRVAELERQLAELDRGR